MGVDIGNNLTALFLDRARVPLARSCAVGHALFVRDGIHSVADYNSTLMGVVVVVLVVLVV